MNVTCHVLPSGAPLVCPGYRISIWYDTVSGQGEGYQDKFIRLPIENKVLIEQIDNLLFFL